MSVTSSGLPQIAFSKNPINLAITSDDYIDVAGVKAICRAIFLTDVAEDQETRLLWASGDVTLVCTATPDGSGNQYPPGTADETYVLSVMALWMQNFYIDRDFDLSYALSDTHPSILFTAKNTGVLFNISEISDPVIEIVADFIGVNETLKPNFAHHLQVWVNFGGTFQKVIQNNLQLDNPVTGVTTKDLSDILHPYLVPGFANNMGSDKPDPFAIGWQHCTNTLLQYYTKLGQYYGASPKVQKLITSDIAFVNIGGLDVLSAHNQTLTGYIKQLGRNDKTLCLRQGSKSVLIQPDQPEFLYWLNLTGADINVKLRITVYHVTGESVPFYSASQAAAAYNKYYFPVGYSSLDINSHVITGKQFAYYTVRATADDGTFLSDLYTYLPDRYREFPRYFIYRNSLGGFQTLYTWGKGQNETDRTKEDVNKQVTYRDAGISGSFIENNIRLQAKCTVNTGYRTAREITLLKDLFVSQEKYLLLNGTMVPIGISSDSFQEAQDGENLNGASFVFNPLFDEIAFTDNLALADNANNSGTQSIFLTDYQGRFYNTQHNEYLTI